MKAMKNRVPPLPAHAVRSTLFVLCLIALFSILPVSLDAQITPTVIESSEPGGDAADLVDGSTSNGWWAPGPLPHYAIVDLGLETTVQSMTLNTGPSYQYTIEASSQPTSGFTTVVDQSANTDPDPYYHEIPDTTARYWKITVTGPDPANTNLNLGEWTFYTTDGNNDLEAPAKPTINNILGGVHRVGLQWHGNGNDPDFAGLNLYRSTTSGFTPSAANRVNDTLFDATQYVDTEAPLDVTSYYVMTAVDTSGNESAPSAEVSATAISIPAVTPPALLTTDNSANWEPGQLIYKDVGYTRQGMVGYMNGSIYMGGYGGGAMRSWKWSDPNVPTSLYMDLDGTGSEKVDFSNLHGTHGYFSAGGVLGGGVSYVSPGVNNTQAKWLVERFDPINPVNDKPADSPYYPWANPHNWNEYGGNAGITWLHRGEDLLAQWDAGAESGVIGLTMLIGNLSCRRHARRAHV